MTPFVKTILASSFGYSEPVTSLVDVHRGGVDSAWMRKRAAADIFAGVELKPDKDHAYLHIIAMGDADTYGCFFAGAPVTTADGLQPIETVTPGTMVLTHRNRYRPVVHVFSSAYCGQRVSVRVGGIPDAIQATANHPILVVRAARCRAGARFKHRRLGDYDTWINTLVADAEWVPARDIRRGDYVVIPCRPEPPQRIEGLELLDPYVMGLYVAEGCLVREYKHGTYSQLLFTVSKKDAASIEYLQCWHHARTGRRITPQQAYDSSEVLRLAFGFRDMAQTLDKIVGHLATTKHLHPAIFTMSDNWKLRFLAGYLDGDGCVKYPTQPRQARYRGTVAASTASVSLAMDLQRLAGSLGIPISVNRCWNRESNGCLGAGDRPIYALSIGSSASNMVLPYCLRLRAHDRPRITVRAALQMSKDYMLAPVYGVKSDSVALQRYNIEVEDDHSYVVSACVGNSNANGDSFLKRSAVVEFPEPKSGVASTRRIMKGNIETHDTFVKHAKVYHAHQNRDPSKASGDVVASAHNDVMNRVELMARVKTAAWRDNLQKIANDELVDASMSVRVRFDICSVCGNEAASRRQYCDHARNHMTELTKSGAKCSVINDYMVYFDISDVPVGADRIAKCMLKAAAADTPVISGAELGEIMNLTPPADIDDGDFMPRAPALDKLALLDKLADIEKEIEASIDGAMLGAERRGMSADVRHAPDGAIDALRPAARHDLDAVLGSMADAKVVLPLRDFMRLVMGSRFDVIEPKLGDIDAALPGVFQRMRTELKCPAMSDVTLSGAPLPSAVREIIGGMEPGLGLGDEPVRRRVTITVIRGGALPKVKSRADELSDADGAKQASGGRLTKRAAETYAAYQLACCERVGDDPVFRRRVVLSNYLAV